MRAAVATAVKQPLSIQDLPRPVPGPGEVLIQIRACGVCFTDLRVIDAIGGPAMPLVPGHEPVGIVAELGPGVSGVKIGDRVGVHALFACGTCELCLRGEEEACALGFSRLAGVAFDGGYAEYMKAPADRIVPLPAALNFAEAAPFFCAGLTTYAGLKNGGLEPGQRVAILGIGGLGHLAIPIARAMGARVYAVTSTPDKAEFAKRLGAHAAGDAASMTAELAGAGGAHVVLHCANSLEPVGKILGGIAKQGAIVLTSADGDSLPIPIGMFTGLQLRVIGSFFGSRKDLREVLDLAAKHEIRPIIERYPLADVRLAHDRLRANAVRYRAVLLPSEVVEPDD